MKHIQITIFTYTLNIYILEKKNNHNGKVEVI